MSSLLRLARAATGTALGLPVGAVRAATAVVDRGPRRHVWSVPGRAQIEIGKRSRPPTAEMLHAVEDALKRIDGVAWAQHLIDSGQYVLDSDWGTVQPRASDQNAFLKSHTWEEYARWHLGLTDGATDHTKARYAFVFGDLRRLHRMGILACEYRAAEWRHKEVELAAHDLLQRLDRRAG